MDVEELAATELRQRTEQLGSDDLVTLKEKIKALEEQNERLARLLEMSVAKPDKDGYSFKDFMLELGATRGQTYGWKKDYAEATQDTGHPVSTEEIQKWQRDGRVPDWAYQQIPSLIYPTRAGKHAAKPEWKESEDEYLMELIHANSKEPNASLATKCSERFGREIDADSIKGKKYRFARAGKFPEYRARG